MHTSERLERYRYYFPHSLHILYSDFFRICAHFVPFRTFSAIAQHREYAPGKIKKIFSADGVKQMAPPASISTTLDSSQIMERYPSSGVYCPSLSRQQARLPLPPLRSAPVATGGRGRSRTRRPRARTSSGRCSRGSP